MQERLTSQIADALDTHLQPLGVAVVLECRHMCMESRGVRHTGTATATATSAPGRRVGPGARRARGAQITIITPSVADSSVTSATTCSRLRATIR